MWSDWTNVVGNLNWWAVIVAALAAFVLGSIWYARGVFGKTWAKLAGIKMDGKISFENMAPLIFGSLVLALISAWGLAVLQKLLGVDGWTSGLSFGLFAGIVFVAANTLTNFLYDHRPLELWMITTGYSVVGLAVMGAILAAWPK